MKRDAATHRHSTAEPRAVVLKRVGDELSRYWFACSRVIPVDLLLAWVSDLIEKLPPEWKSIHIRHLLTHTSGLPEMSDNPRFTCLPDDKKKRITAEEEIAFLVELPLKFPAGEKFSYHLSGYQLLGFIVEKLTKESYSAFLEEHVFALLGMTSTRFGGTEATVIKRRSSTSYSRQSGALESRLLSRR